MTELSQYDQRIYPEVVPDPSGWSPPEFITPERGPNLRDYQRVVHKHLKLIASLVASALLVTVLMVLTMTRIYTAKSTLLIEPQAPQVLDIRNLISEPTGPQEDGYLKTQEEILKSRSLAAQVIRDLQLERDPLFSTDTKDQGLVSGLLSAAGSLLKRTILTDAAHRSLDAGGVDGDLIDLYLERLTIKSQIGTRLLTVAFSLSDPVAAARIANAHVGSYVRRGLEMHAQASENAGEFLEKKLVELKERVEKSEAALNNYRRDRGIVAFTLDDKSTILNQRLTEINQALTKAQTERIDLEAQYNLTQTSDRDSLPAVLSSPLIGNLKAEDERVEGQYASMAEQFKPDYPPLQELKAKVDETRARLHAEIRHVVDGIESNYKTAVARENELRKEVEQQNVKALALNDASLQDAVLAREVDANRQLYKSVLERMKEIGVAGEVPASNVSIVDRAIPPRHPSSPRPLLDLSLAGILSLLCGVALAFLLDHLDDTLHNPEEAELYLGLPTLGSVPEFPLLEIEEDSADAAVLTEVPPALPQLTSNFNSKEIVVSSSRFSAAGESFRAIRTSILLSCAAQPPKTVVIASGTKSEGKTITALNIAAAFAHLGTRVLLVDGDLRRSRCHVALGVQNLAGLTEVLVGQKKTPEVIQQISGEMFSFLSAGAIPPNPTELLASQRMRDLLAELAGQYDMVLIDMPPVMLVSDSVILSQMVDGVVMVIGSHTPKQVARLACERLRRVDAKILGVVLNRVRLDGADYYHYQRYSAYEDYYKAMGGER